MDSAAVVMPQPSPLLPSRGSRISSNSVTVGRGRPAIGILSSGFSDRGHLQSRDRRSPLLSTAVMAVINGKEDKAVKDRASKKMKKQQLKLLKELTRDLSTSSQVGFGLDSEAIVDQEAADVLLGRLQKLRSEEKELKRKRKEEKARLKASSQMQTRAESSSSKCDEVVDIKSFKQKTHMEEQQNVLKQLTLDKENSLPPAPIASIINHPMQSYAVQTTNIASENNVAVSPCCSKRIEVCMGGKCKKSGAAVLLEAFKKAVGMEGEVSSCKCMGKCKEGPNVKVVNNSNSSAAQPQEALCKGVGMEDVEMIVSKFLVENQKNQMGFAAAA